MSSQALRVDPKTQLFEDDFAANSADLPGAGLSWLDSRRVLAMESFAATGVPTRRMEAWKYTDLAGALDGELEPATLFRADTAATTTDVFADLPGTRVVLMNGFLHYIGGTALTDDIDIVDLTQLSARTPEWVRLYLGTGPTGGGPGLGTASLALMRGGIAVRVRAGAQGLSPLHLRFINPSRSQPLMCHSRVLIVLEEDAQLDLLESHSGVTSEQVLANLGVEFVLKKNARLNQIRVQEEGTHTLHITSLDARVAGGAHYQSLLVNLGAHLSRVDMNVRLEEPLASVGIRAATVLGGEAAADVTTIVDHAAPHTKSRQLFKSVVGGRAKAVSQGRVTVRKGAVKSDSHQMFKALLLAPRAEADAKPELEIFADDVVCGHGTAIGALDEDALFYLRSRGILAAEARQMMVRAFLEDAIGEGTSEAIHDAIWARIDAAMTNVEDVP